MIYKGIDNIQKELSFFRSMGNQETGSQLGFGFKHKEGITIDEKNTSFPYYSAIYVIRGKGVYIDCSGKKYDLSQGSLFQRLPGEQHSTILDPHSRWAECYIDFGANIYRDLLINLNIVDPESPVIQLKEDPEIEETIWIMLKELEQSAEQNLPDLMLKSLKFLRSILVRKVNYMNSNAPLNIVEKSCRDFSQNYKKRIDLKEYCRNQGIGYESFRKNFKRVTGLSPGKYIIRRRIDKACQVLLMSDDSIGKIAEELGYKSPYELSSQFKDLTGISPREYRQKKNKER